MKNNGSYLDQNKTPYKKDKIWVMTAKIGIGSPQIGVIHRITNIDNKGLSNTYLDILVGNKILHVNIMLVYDHKPKKVKITDICGEIVKWE